MELRIAPGPGVPRGLSVPAAELVERFSRSSGPGGQSVNTADSRVELRFDVAGSPTLTESQRARILQVLGGRLVDGWLIVVASEHRNQLANRAAARQRMAGQLAAALAPPPRARRAPGRPGGPGSGAWTPNDAAARPRRGAPGRMPTREQRSAACRWRPAMAACAGVRLPPDERVILIRSAERCPRTRHRCAG